VAWAERISGSKSWRGGWRTPDNKKHHTSRRTHPEHPYARKTDALQAAREAEVRAQRQASVEAGVLAATITWGEWWDVIAPSRSREDSNTDGVEQRIVDRYLRPQWGGEPLNRIGHKAVQRWVNALRDGMAAGWTHRRKPEPSYVLRIYAVFRASFQRAMDDEVLSASPCAGVRLPTLRRKRKQHLTVDESATIGAKLRQDYRDAVDFALETGLRPSELCGLHVHRVDQRRRVIEVCEVYVNRKWVIRGFPKDKDARLVPLTSRAVEILSRRIEGRDLSGGCGVHHTDGSECGSALVFLTDRGRPMKPEEITTRMKYAAKAHGVPRRTAYAPRRGYATRLADGGVNPVRGAEVMGHATVDQFREYVQETAAAHASVLAALGEQQPLAVVPGANWGSAGADPAKQPAGGNRIERAEDAV
jgi:integrase